MKTWAVICTNGRMVSVSADDAEPIPGQSGVIFYKDGKPIHAFYCIDGFYEVTSGSLHGELPKR